jgi:hypothetical protein
MAGMVWSLFKDKRARLEWHVLAGRLRKGDVLDIVLWSNYPVAE